MVELKNYDLIVIGSGSATNLIDPLIQSNPKMKIAIIDKDEPGGICLTRGCIPSKILLYPAELVRHIEEARELGVEADITKIDFLKIMERMRSLIGKDIESIRQGLSSSENIDYYHDVAEFVSPYTMKVGSETIKSGMIFLTTGSKTIIPNIKGLEEVGYLTSDTCTSVNKTPAKRRDLRRRLHSGGVWSLSFFDGCEGYYCWKKSKVPPGGRTRGIGTCEKGTREAHRNDHEL